MCVYAINAILQLSLSQRKVILMDRDKVKLLGWLRKFVYTDIDSLDSFGIIRLWINLNILKEYGFLEETNQRSVAMSHVNNALDNPELISSESLKRQQADFSQKFHEFLNNVTDNAKQKSPFKPFNVHVFVSAETDEGSIRVRSEKPKNLLQEDTRLFHVFLRSVNGIHTSCFKKCPECNRLFFNFTRRTKLYCNNKCAARKGNRDKRALIKEEDPEAYKRALAENAKRARKSYDRKVKAKSGKNVKIARKPKKK
jgi:hypothetical protein